MMRRMFLLALAATRPVTAADVEAGKADFKKCALCHTTEAGKNKIGPSLFNLIGRPAGTVPGYSYSPAMHDLNKTWDIAVLDEYLTSPKALVPGTKMTFPGIADKKDRDDVIAFISTLR